MSRQREQKIKLLILFDILDSSTDEDQPMDTNQILEELSAKGIEVSRKVLPDDIELLNQFGYQINVIPGKPNKYYAAQHRFSQAEAMLFSDALIASKLDERHKQFVISKLSDSISESQADRVYRHVIMKGMPKRGNESILKSIEIISSAIENNHKASFRYFSLDENKSREYKVRKSGSQIYRINPITMMWDRDNYYLVFYYDNHETTHRYRIDRMDDVTEEATERQFHPALQFFDSEEYRRQLFSMFGGDLYDVRINFKKEMLNDIYDHYGEDVVIRKLGEDQFSAIIKVQVGKTFFGWVAGTGGCVRIESPAKVQEQFMYDLLEGKEVHCEFDGVETVIKDDGRYCCVPVTHKVTLGEIVDLLEQFKNQPTTLMMPKMPNGSFAKKLYSLYLSYLPSEKFKYALKMNIDNRGSFTELIHTEDCGQVSINISKPGITKGQHWHNSKWELFIVVQGHGLIQERNINTGEMVEFEVSGDRIEAVHMIPGWTHNIINLSETENLVTVMTCNEVFNPNRPDTFHEDV